MYIFGIWCIGFTDSKSDIFNENPKTLEILPSYRLYTKAWRKIRNVWVNPKKCERKKKARGGTGHYEWKSSSSKSNSNKYCNRKVLINTYQLRWKNFGHRQTIRDNYRCSLLIGYAKHIKITSHLIYLVGSVPGDLTGCIRIISGISSSSRAQKCDPDEADERILIHKNHAIQIESYRKIIVAATDTDIFTALLHHYHRVSTNKSPLNSLTFPGFGAQSSLTFLWLFYNEIKNPLVKSKIK